MVQVAQIPNVNPSFEWEDLLGLLRDELQEYGGLVGLLNAQQQSILSRRPNSLLEINQSVQTQMEASQMFKPAELRIVPCVFYAGRINA